MRYVCGGHRQRIGDREREARSNRDSKRQKEGRMPSNPLDDLCDAIRALPPTTAMRAINALLSAKVINYNDAFECGRAIMILRELVKKRDAKAD